jgi:hypothetical protein
VLELELVLELVLKLVPVLPYPFHPSAAVGVVLMMASGTRGHCSSRPVSHRGSVRVRPSGGGEFAGNVRDQDETG